MNARDALKKLKPLKANKPAKKTSTRRTTAKPALASELVAALERTWETIQRNHLGIPNAVLIVGSGTENPRRRKWGHFGADRWTDTNAEGKRPEVMIAGERLAHGAEAVLGTLLHEAAHGANAAANIKDTSRQGRFHNAAFKSAAEHLGLTVTQNETNGWSDTEPTPETLANYRAALADLRGALELHRQEEAEKPAKEKEPDRNGLKCQCDCGRIIRVARAVLEAGEITCSICDAPFQPVDA